MNPIDVTKSGDGAIGGFVKSKKYLLTFAFVSFCTVACSEATNATIKVALVAAAALAVMAYLLGQSWVESRGIQIIEQDPATSDNSVTTTTTTATATAVK